MLTLLAGHRAAEVSAWLISCLIVCCLPMGAQHGRPPTQGVCSAFPKGSRPVHPTATPVGHGGAMKLQLVTLFGLATYLVWTTAFAGALAGQPPFLR